MVRSIPTYVRMAGIWMLLALVGGPSLLAQRYTFRQYGSAEGLSNLAVNCLAQDAIGYIWVGTDDGLFRYDGSRFQRFGHTEGLPNVEIHGLAVSPEGVLWAATQGGIAQFDGRQFKTEEIGESGPVWAIAFDRSAQMYLQHGSGIMRGVRNSVGTYVFRPVANGAVSGMFLDGADVWFGRDGDLWRQTRDRAERVGSTAGLPLDRWSAISRDIFGNLWVRSSTRLYEMRPGGTHAVDRSAGIPQAPGGRLYADPQGPMFVSTSEGAVVLDGAIKTHIDALHGLPADVVGPVLIDREGSLWLGLVGGGLVRRLGHGDWLSWKREDGILHNSVWAILHDGAGQTWVGSSGGLNLLDVNGEVMRSWTSRNGLPVDRVLSIVEGPGGDIFVGTDPSGLSHFSAQAVLLHTYGAAAGLTGRVAATAIDRLGRLWAVGEGGCFRSRTPVSAATALKFERIAIPGMTPETVFREVLVKGDGSVWLATSHGLAHFDGVRWRVFTERDGLKSADLDAIAERQGVVWVAYRDALGMTRIEFSGERTRLTHFTKQDGLASDLIYALAFDATGRLWLTTDNGVDVLQQGLWHRFGREDGLIWDDGNSRGLSVDREGKVWVGTSGGLSRYTMPFHPAPDLRPAVVLTAIEGGSKEWQAEDQPALPYAQRSLEIRFASLSYTFEDRTRFRYRLKGYENGWTETSEQSVHFAALPAGRYVFEVVAAGPNGLWTEVPARFAFSILTPWWRSWWFLTLSVMMSLLLGRVAWSLRVRVLVAQKRSLEQQVSDRTVELIKSHRQLEELAYCDVLTSLPNRRRFTEEFRTRLALARRHGELFALLLIDLDRFKQINDTFGHDAGDAVLIELAVRLRVAVRETDCVARLGGDEFAILLSTTDSTEYVDAVCRRIIDGFVSRIPLQDASLKAGCSIGVASFPDDGDSQEELYKSADLALYEAKRLTGDAYCWSRTAKEAEALMPWVESDQGAATL